MTAKLAAAPEPTTYDWPSTRTHAIQAFNGDTPGQTMEAAIVIHFQAEPVRVLQLVDAIGRRVSQGQVRSGWAVLRHELEQRPALVTTASDGQERSVAVRLAEAWIRHAGHLVDREEELLDELFGVRGRLRWWPDLQPRMTELWNARRASGDEGGERVVVRVGAESEGAHGGAARDGEVADAEPALASGGCDGAAAGSSVGGAAGSLASGGAGVAAGVVEAMSDEVLAYLDTLEIPEGDDAP